MIVALRRLLAGILSITLAAPALPETHDAVGNRTQKTSTIPGFPGGLTNYNANDQLATDTYDNDGNTTASNGVGYVYDFENHVIQAGAGITVVYDGDGNRVSKTVAGVTTKYLVDPVNPTGYAQVVQESMSGSNSVNRELTRAFVYGLERISQLRSYLINGTSHAQTSYYAYDGHGSTRALTDPNGVVTDTYDYDAFGNLIHSAATGIPPGGTTVAPTPNEFLFAGEQFDSDLNLYYNRARYLNVSTGRFWTMDKFEGRSLEPASLHKYLYAGADPVNRRDPSGRDIIDTLGALAIQAIGYTQAILPYVVTIGLVAEAVYVSTGLFISVDVGFFGGSPGEWLYTLRDGAGYVFLIAYFITEAGQSVGLVGSGARKQTTQGAPSRTVLVPKSRYPLAAQHIEEAEAAGQPTLLTIDRGNAVQRRAEALRGVATVPGLDRDEFPPAMFAEGGAGSSVRLIPPSDNRGAGAFIGNQLSDLPDGARVKLGAVDDTQK